MSNAMNFDHLVELCRLKHEGMQPTLSGELTKPALSSGIQPTPSVELDTTHQTAAELIKSVENLIRRFPLGWSHYVELGKGQLSPQLRDPIPSTTSNLRTRALAP